MKTCIQCGEPTASICSICEQPICHIHMLEARLYINGKRTATVADIHAQASKPAHPETLKGDTWEWRVAK